MNPDNIIVTPVTAQVVISNAGARGIQGVQGLTGIQGIQGLQGAHLH